MMKLFIYLGLIVSLIACKSTTTATASSHEENIQQTKQKTPSGMLVGKQDRAALEQQPFGSWFNKNFKNYKVDTKTVAEIKPLLEGVTIKAFMGTWCGDSKRETPTFYKILDAADFNYDDFQLITVSRNKTTPGGLEKNMDIIRVPTFIFYKEGKELGRYVEYPRTSLEKDMLAILSGAGYKHSYEN